MTAAGTPDVIGAQQPGAAYTEQPTRTTEQVPHN